MDVDARVQLFDLKTKYQFVTSPGVDQYNMPLYNVQIEPGSQNIGIFPVYQGFLSPAYINGITVRFETQKDHFFNGFPNVLQYGAILATGNGTNGPYTLTFPISPNNTLPLNPPVQALLRGHVDITGIIATGNNVDPFFGTTLSNTGGLNPTFNIPSTSIFPAVYFTSTDAYGNSIVVQDSGQFLIDQSGNMQANYGLLMQPGNAPFGYTTLPNGGGLPTPYSTTQNTINYITGVATNVYFPTAIPQGTNIMGNCYYFQCGLPRAILYYNNVITLRNPPDTQYIVEMDAYLSPAAFLQTASAIPFGYMAEYIARGAARKILSDTGDVEQFMFYEPLFKEQEQLVWKRSQRQWTSTRTQTIYSQGINQGQGGFNSVGGSTI